MDIATLIGIIAGFGLIILNIIGGGNAAIFVHFPSMMIVFGGSFAAVLVNFPLKEVIGVFKVVSKAFFGQAEDPLPIIDTLYDLSKSARKDGLLAIDKKLSSVDNDFLRTGLEMAVDGSEAETIRNVMETELSYLMGRHLKGQQILMALGIYAPAFGMVGTLIGLVGMLANMEDPSSIGPSMSVALITTFYGALIANLVFLPLGGKLKNKSDDEIVIKEMIIEGVLAIPAGEHPKNIRRKMLNFVPPTMRGESSDKI